MRLLVGVLVAAFVIGLLAGGRFRNMEQLRLRWWGLAPIGLAMQFGPGFWSGETGRLVALGLLIASYPVLMLFALKNIRIAGFLLILIGLALNMTVIAANGGMPVSRSALVSSGQGELARDLDRGPGQKHHLERDSDILLPLADVIPVGTPINQVVSIGDILVYGGVLWLVIAAMRGRAVLVWPRPRKQETAAAHP